MIAHGLPIYVALEPVDMRLGYERLGGIAQPSPDRRPARPAHRSRDAGGPLDDPTIDPGAGPEAGPDDERDQAPRIPPGPEDGLAQRGGIAVEAHRGRQVEGLLQEAPRGCVLPAADARGGPGDRRIPD